MFISGRFSCTEPRIKWISFPCHVTNESFYSKNGSKYSFEFNMNATFTHSFIFTCMFSLISRTKIGFDDFLNFSRNIIVASRHISCDNNTSIKILQWNEVNHGSEALGHNTYDRTVIKFKHTPTDGITSIFRTQFSIA